MTNLYDFTVKAQDGTDISLSKYQGKVLLVVNTATGCGLTPQYEGLQKLYDTYHNKGFEILDFPCNQFMNQAPGTADEINTFCTLNYQTTFPRFAKIKVNGKEANPLYDWLKSQAKGPLASVLNGILPNSSLTKMEMSSNAFLQKQNLKQLLQK